MKIKKLISKLLEVLTFSIIMFGISYYMFYQLVEVELA